jgi:hypothetical protein
MAAPDTVTDALALLRSEGYVDDFDLCDDGVRCPGEPGTHRLAGAVVDHTFRFEGPSDPADEAIVLGISLPAWRRKGVIVSAYGPDVDPEHARLLAELTRGEQRHG